jgi:Stage II sporulation protein E (SpoIIE)/GAF domain
MARSPLSTSAPTREPVQDRTLERLVQHVRELAAVDAVLILTVDATRAAIERSAGWFGAEGSRARVETLGGGPLDARGQDLLETVLEAEQPLVLERLDAWDAARELPALSVGAIGPERARSLWRAYRGSSVLACTLRGVDRQPLGVLVAASLDPDSALARSGPSALESVCELAAMTLRERRVAHALTLGFVPEPLPELPGYETGLLYAPVLNDPAGGDIYGAWSMPGGELAVVVGDVAGKGVETAALSSMVRFFVEARSWDCDSSAAVLEQTNAMLLERLPADTFVTAFLALLSSEGLRYCNAGHLPPLHLSHTGVRELPGHGVPLGVESKPGYLELERRLDPGDLLFAYTDGLVEARREREIFGTGRLTRLVEEQASSLSPEQLVRRVHGEVSRWADRLADDALALALRREDPAAVRSA